MKYKILTVIIGLAVCLCPAYSPGSELERECVEGDCQNGQVGEPKFSDVEAEYVGGFKDGYFDGQGTLTTGDGTKYVGAFKEGEFHGRGVETNVLGVKYVGEFEHGKRHGYGILTFSWGGSSKYVGNFKYGLKHGYGVEGTVSGGGNVGYWLDGMYVGKEKPAELEANERERSKNSDKKEKSLAAEGVCVEGDCLNGQGTKKFYLK